MNVFNFILCHSLSRILCMILNVSVWWCVVVHSIGIREFVRSNAHCWFVERPNGLENRRKKITMVSIFSFFQSRGISTNKCTYPDDSSTRLWLPSQALVFFLVVCVVDDSDEAISQFEMSSFFADERCRVGNHMPPKWRRHGLLGGFLIKRYVVTHRQIFNLFFSNLIQNVYLLAALSCVNQ